MSEQPEDPKPGGSDSDAVDDAISRYRKHNNPFGEHPNGVGSTLGEDLDADSAPAPPD